MRYTITRHNNPSMLYSTYYKMKCNVSIDCSIGEFINAIYQKFVIAEMTEYAAVI